MYNSSGVLVFGESGVLPASSGLLANLIARLTLGPLALLVSWVPLRMLWKNGEFPACVFVLCNSFNVLLIVCNAAIWHNQDFDSWWLGFGWCDFNVYVQYAILTLYSASICAMMRRLAGQVGLTRVGGLSGREKRRALLGHALIMFPVPVLQAVLTVFVQGQRYMIAPVLGCDKAFYGNAVYLVFFILPSPLFTAAACYFTFQTYRRFRQIEASTRLAISGANSVAYARSQRARRKLYLMTLSILMPYAPLEALFFVYNIYIGWPWQRSSSFHFVHFAGIVPWNSIYLADYTRVTFGEMNANWISIITAYVIFVFFGTSKEAVNTYRRGLLRIGLVRFFPGLDREYDPDRSLRSLRRSGGRSQTQSQWPSQATTLHTNTTLTSASDFRKGSLVPTCRRVSDLESQDASSTTAPTSTWRTRIHSFFQRLSSSVLPGPFAHSAADELELHGHAASFASRPASRPAAPVAPPIFNPGLNWGTPPVVPAMPVWKIAVPQSSSQAAQLPQLPQPPQPTHRPHTSPCCCRPQAASASAPETQDSRPTSSPFDGAVLHGGTVSTRVWADGEGAADEQPRLGGTMSTRANVPQLAGTGTGAGTAVHDWAEGVRVVRVEYNVSKVDARR